MKRVIIANDNQDHLEAVRLAVVAVCSRNGDQADIVSVDERDFTVAARVIEGRLSDLETPPYDLTILDMLYPGNPLGGIDIWARVPNAVKGRAGALLVVSNSDNPAVSAFAVANNGSVIALTPSRSLKQMIGQALGFPARDYSK